MTIDVITRNYGWQIMAKWSWTIDSDTVVCVWLFWRILEVLESNHLWLSFSYYCYLKDLPFQLWLATWIIFFVQKRHLDNLLCATTWGSWRVVHNKAYSSRICAANIENSKICMSLHPYLKIIYTIHHSVHYRKLCLIIG